MDARQHSTIRASGQPQWSDIEPLSLEEVQHVVAALHRRQGELERQNEALHQIQRQDTERQALLGRLASALSHDIRNPLNAIFLHTDLLAEDLQQLPPDHRVQMLESLAEIKTEVARLHDMMQDYLTLARLADLQPQPEELGTLVEDLGLEMQESLEARGLTLCLEGLEHLGHVALHRTTLHRALYNLVHQAMDAMPQGGALTIRGRQEGPKVHLEVCDSGPGIPEEELPWVFDLLHAIHPEGTGLGLYVAHAIVVAHGGTLTVQSTRDHGTTFTMILPCTGGA